MKRELQAVAQEGNSLVGTNMRMSKRPAVNCLAGELPRRPPQNPVANGQALFCVCVLRRPLSLSVAMTCNDRSGRRLQ